MIGRMIAREVVRSTAPGRPRTTMTWQEANDKALASPGGCWLLVACWIAVPTFVILVMIFGTWTH
jgi:hypothetical protein